MFCDSFLLYAHTKSCRQVKTEHPHLPVIGGRARFLRRSTERDDIFFHPAALCENQLYEGTVAYPATAAITKAHLPTYVTLFSVA